MDLYRAGGSVARAAAKLPLISVPVLPFITFRNALLFISNRGELDTRVLVQRTPLEFSSPCLPLLAAMYRVSLRRMRTPLPTIDRHFSEQSRPVGCAAHLPN